METGEFGAGASAAGRAVEGCAGTEDEVAAGVFAGLGWSGEFDVVDGRGICAGDTAGCEGDADGGGVIHEGSAVVELKGSSVICGDEEPVASPGDVASDEAAFWYRYGYRFTVSVAGDVFDRDCTVGMQLGNDDADGRFDAVYSDGDAAEMGERGDKADGAVAAHAKGTDVIKEDDGSSVRGAGWRAEECADDDF